MKERIEADIKSAMLNRNNVQKEILKFIKSEIQRKEGGLIVMSNEDIQKLLRNQIECLKQTPSETSSQEIEILESYLPKLMTEDEIRKEIELLGTEPNITWNIPTIMKHFTNNFKGKVDNKLVSQIANTYFKK